MFSDSTLKLNFSKLTSIEFGYSVKIIIVSDKVLKILLPFATVYLCEADFHFVCYKLNKLGSVLE